MSDADRDSWCTPKWLASLIGLVDVDPCSNDRSHVEARVRWSGHDFDGLALASTVEERDRVFVNPPYSSGQVIRWVRAYLRTDFMFLVRLDPSTEWWALLMSEAPMVWAPDRRIAFDPPPGIKASANPFPHAIVARTLPRGLLTAGGYAWSPIARPVAAVAR